MARAETPVGAKVTWTAEHRRDGVLISRQVAVLAPKWPACNCVLRYFWRVLRYTALQKYHSRRVALAEKRELAPTPDWIRTGERVPKSLPGIVFESMTLRFRR